MQRNVVTGAFAARVRSGMFGLGEQVKAGSVSQALSAISKTIELAGQPSPIYRWENKYQTMIERIVEGFRRTNPPTTPQLAVPVSVAKTAYTNGLTSNNPLIKHCGCLIMIAFYFYYVSESTPNHVL